MSVSAGAGQRTIDVDERRRTYLRFLIMSVAAWTVFAVTDLVAARAHGAPLEYLAALRLTGTGIGVLAILVVRNERLPSWVLDVLEIGLFPMASLLVSLAALECGGAASPLAHGVGIITLVRAVLPAPWTRALPSAVASAATFPITVYVASLGSPPLAAQLASPAWWTFFQSNIFLLLGAALATVAAQLQWHAREQVNQARRLGVYRLVARVGAGGMGEVWLARQITLDRRVALKLLKESIDRDPTALRRFKREAEAASRLAHPHTIRVFDFGASDDGVFYIAMEFLDGLDLEALVKRAGPLPASRAIHFARQACASLAEAHQRGVVHCDIKPANLFVTKVGDEYDFVKVLDFGLARLVAAGHTTVDSIRGTPAFMPPEVIRGERPGPESDVYSMGAVLYWMVTGTTVFRGQGFHEAMVAHLEGKPERPSDRLGSEVPADLEALILRCLTKSRADRIATARELDEALARCGSAKDWSNHAARASWEDIRPSLGLLAASPEKKAS